jgi:lysophospholipase L1-like esterase
MDLMYKYEGVDFLKNSVLRISTIIAVLLTCLWIFGFSWTIQDSIFGRADGIEEHTAPPEMAQTKKTDITLLALGDSLTRGTGDETGQGYVGIVTEQLKKELDPGEVTVYNLGINGQNSSQLLQQLGQKNISRQVKEADVILMTIGGNDLFQGGDVLLDFNLEKIVKTQKQYVTNLEQIFTTIREQNTEATLFILGLYNPFIDLEHNDVTNNIVREWNYSTENVAGKFEKVVFVPTFDLFQLSVNDYLYSDHFHPNQAGYGLISNRLAPLINWEKEAEAHE